MVGGGFGRLGAPIVSFAIAALASGACALLFTRGRQLASLLYFTASLAIVYGFLAMLTLPLRLAVSGTCQPAPAGCGPGLERPLTVGESSALGLAIALGIAAILAGYFGLAMLRRREERPRPQSTPAPRSSPAVPTRRIPPVVVKTQAPIEPVTSEAAAPPTPAKTESQATMEPMQELAAPIEPLELPEVGTADRAEAAPQAPQPKPRRKRVPKATPDPPTTPDSGAAL